MSRLLEPYESRLDLLVDNLVWEIDDDIISEGLYERISTDADDLVRGFDPYYLPELCDALELRDRAAEFGDPTDKSLGHEIDTHEGRILFSLYLDAKERLAEVAGVEL